jgi:hypothetical protein
MKSIIFWDMTPCSPLSCTRRFGRSYRLLCSSTLKMEAIRLATCLLDGLLNYSSTLKMEVIRSSETSGATQRTTRRHIPEDDTLNCTGCSKKASWPGSVSSNALCKPMYVCMYVCMLISDTSNDILSIAQVTVNGKRQNYCH